ncbi:MAG: hypothetical protein VR78_14440 [Hoeflea sp. BRH_c9]|nr:MAG: hypothetical protein VR78_14440 [Hoeflea sp. BRH_c9]
MGMQVGRRDGRQYSGEKRFEIRLEDAPGHAAFGTEQVNDVGLKPGLPSRDCRDIQNGVQSTLNVIPAGTGNMSHHIVDVAVRPEPSSQCAGKSRGINAHLLRHNVSVTFVCIPTETKTGSGNQMQAGTTLSTAKGFDRPRLHHGHRLLHQLAGPGFSVTTTGRQGS